MKKYLPNKKTTASKQRVAKNRIKSVQDKGQSINKIYHKPDWIIQEKFD